MWKQWKTFDAVPEQKRLAERLGVQEWIAGLLLHRGICGVEEAGYFLHPETQPFHDPFLMKDMDTAVQRICQAINHHEKITVYGDYDVDGMSSTALLIHNLRRLGSDPAYYIPDRHREGYGFNRTALQKLAENGTDLLISVDCGIASTELAEEMAGSLDMIITDHHLPGDSLPRALAVVNPHRQDCPYPDKNLAGVGVTYKLCQALWQSMRNESYTEDQELVALGTVADIVPLLGENRRLVYSGLANMRTSSFTGIRALIDVADIKEEKLTASHVGFRLAPRLNAAGRIGTARLGVELLLADEEGKAAQLAMELDLLNKKRQAIEQEILQRAEEQLSGEDPENLPAIVIAGEDWDPGVIGIVASRLVDRYYKPTIVMSIQSDGICRGSCRSIEGLHMYHALESCREHILQFGGHAQAAGVSVRVGEFQAFRQAFQSVSSSMLSDEDYIPKIPVELELKPEALTFDMVEELEQLEPYGMGNPKPLFGCRNIRGTGAAAIGSQRQHLRFQVGGPQGKIHALYWNRSDLAGIVNAEHVDMVYSPSVNEWMGVRSLQCIVEDLEPGDRERIFPEREQLVEIYRFLYQIQQTEGNISYTAAELAVRFSAMVHHISLYTMSMGLCIFQELNLLRTDLQEKGYSLQKTSNRMELKYSRTFCRHH